MGVHQPSFEWAAQSGFQLAQQKGSILNGVHFGRSFHSFRPQFIITYFPNLDLAFENGFRFFFIILLEFIFDFGQLQSHLTVWL